MNKLISFLMAYYRRFKRIKFSLTLYIFIHVNLIKEMILNSLFTRSVSENVTPNDFPH